ncbi:MAG: DNA polymerase III subunit epsilon [Betaproteobacteria bacterium]|jgi:DNA polymerase-3 subunit epsilon|nr:MAG: DNA polymerase III subunit epsilon [Betaproteobacteria bacterium]
MRQIVLDTETTGLDPTLGHRIIEIAAIEMVSRQITGRDYHCYVNPEREIDPGALEVHGISREFLADKPKFADIAPDFLKFIEGSELIIHNAPFDVAFLNAELEQAGREPITEFCEMVTDTLKIARELHPGKRSSLDALCERYAVDNSARTLHGALLDTRLLAEVYLAMTRGQESLLMEVENSETFIDASGALGGDVELLVICASDEEFDQHRRALDDIDKVAAEGCLWRRLDANAASYVEPSTDPAVMPQRSLR